jgi:membrane associated rhomboid family serine protease
MLPLANPLKPQIRPYFTYILIVISFLVYAAQGFFPQETINSYSVIPRQFDLFDADSLLDIVRGLFIHASLVHLLLNMLYLWIFGEMVEGWLGAGWYAGMYFLSGVAAVLIQMLLDSGSDFPIVGSSGAVAGVMGAYLVLYPNTRLKTITPNSVVTGKLNEIPAAGGVVVWFVIQMLAGLFSLDMGSGEGGIAFFAHIVGFIVGVTFARQRLKRAYGKSYRFPAPVPNQTYGNIIPMQRPSQRGGSLRSPDKPAYNWQATDATSGAALKQVEATLRDLKEQVGAKNTEKSPEEKPTVDLSYLPLPARKRQAIRYLSTKHGDTVSLQTDSKNLHRGKVVKMTGTQVVLEDEQKNTRWILFTEITRIF